MYTYSFIYKFGLMRYLLDFFKVGKNVTEVLTVIGVIICIAAGYWLGGFNFAIIISKKKFGVDVRDFGSGNAGMTNMHRTFGKKAGAITLVGDMGKAIVSCLIGYLLLGLLGAYIAGLFCILGHMFPIKYKFKGGKGVACTAAVILMTSAGDPTFYFLPIIFFIILTFFIVIVLGSKFISLGSIFSVFMYPLILSAFQQFSQLYYPTEDAIYTIISVTIALLVIFMHRENMKRLLKGTESKFDLHMSGKKTLYEQKLDEESDLKNTNDSRKEDTEK